MADKVKIKIDGLDKEIQSIFAEFQHSVTTAMEAAINNVARRAKTKLKKTSPSWKYQREEKYSEDWEIKQEDKQAKSSTVIANKQYQLTHLLEKGHDIVINGEVRGHADAIPHIEPVSKDVANEIQEELKKQIARKVK